MSDNRTSLDRIWELNGLADEIQRANRSLIRSLRIELVVGGIVLHGHAFRYYGKQVVQCEVLRRCDLQIVSNRIAVQDCSEVQAAYASG